MSALLLDDALKPATPLTNGAINQTLRQFAPLGAPELSWIVNIDKPSTKKTLTQHNRRNFSLSCLEATWQAGATLITQLVTVVTCLSAMSDISQDSVATLMRCNGIVNVNVTTNFLLIPSVKELWKSVNIWWSYWHIKFLCHFLAHPVVVHTCNTRFIFGKKCAHFNALFSVSALYIFPEWSVFYYSYSALIIWSCLSELRQ